MTAAVTAGQLLEAWTRLLQWWSWQPPAADDGGVHDAVAEATTRIVAAVLEATMQDLERGAADEAGDDADEVCTIALFEPSV